VATLLKYTLTKFNGKVEIVLGRGYMKEVYLVEGDTDPDLEITVKDQDGTVVDLTGLTVVFTMTKIRTGDKKVDAGSCTLNADPTTGKFTYTWDSTDLNEPGVLEGEFDLGDQKIYEMVKIFVRRKRGT